MWIVQSVMPFQDNLGLQPKHSLRRFDSTAAQPPRSGQRTGTMGYDHLTDYPN